MWWVRRSILEVSLRNLAGTKEKGSAYHKAMIERVNRGRTKLDAILKAMPIPELAPAVTALPSVVGPDTPATLAGADALRAATRQFVQKQDGATLGPLDALIPKTIKGKVHRP